MQYLLATHLANLPKAAQRALTNAAIQSREQLARLTESEMAQLHGIGKNALSTLKAELQKCCLAFREE